MHKHNRKPDIQRWTRSAERVLKTFFREAEGVRLYQTYRNTRCLFILSTGRTGTATLGSVLSLSDDIDAFHEPYPQLLFERKSARTAIHTDRDTYGKIFKKARGAALKKSLKLHRLYAEMSARLTFFAPVIADLLPNAKFLYLHRHPAEIIRSGMRRKWYVDHPADFARIEPVPSEEGFVEWSNWDPFQKICWYWNAYNKFALSFRERVPEPRIMTVQADSIYDGSAILGIFRFLGVRYPGEHVVKDVLSKKLNAQLNEDYPHLEDWSDDRVHFMEQICGDTMDDLCYSRLRS